MESITGTFAGFMAADAVPGHILTAISGKYSGMIILLSAPNDPGYIVVHTAYEGFTRPTEFLRTLQRSCHNPARFIAVEVELRHCRLTGLRPLTL
jgi:hypothetical protein